MSAPVDVLAVLDRALAFARDATTVRGITFSYATDLPDELEEIRAAVAELIEAAAALCGAIEFRIDDPRNALRDRAVMALAGCGGAK